MSDPPCVMDKCCASVVLQPLTKACRAIQRRAVWSRDVDLTLELTYVHRESVTQRIQAMKSAAHQVH